jgi:hypothetical protein
MLSKIAKYTLLLLCGVLLFAGCEGVNGLDGKDGLDGTNGVDGKDGLNALNSPLKLTAEGYSVAHPNTAAATNYILLDVEAGDYTKGTYTLGGTTVTPTPVLTNGHMTTLAKIAVPASGTTFALAVTEDGESVLTKDVTFSAAGATTPTTPLYGEKFMTFSEYFHDITANIADIRPASTAFSATGYVAEPKKFINEGTFRGTSSPKWTDTDSQPKVDVISSASYGDNAHFVPPQNLAMNYPDPKTTADWHKVTGIKTVQVGVIFDLYANAVLLRQAGKAVATSAAVLATMDGIDWKAAGTIYKAKYLQNDASWGKRDETAITSGTTVAKAWPKNAAERNVNVSYGGSWADKVISVDFAPLPTDMTNQIIWDDYFDYLYAGYVEDLQTGHKEPLVWLQNLFTHQGHTNIEAAIQRAGISRMNSLSPAGNFKVVMFAIGFQDIIIESVAVVADGASVPSIEQASPFYVSPNATALLDSGGNSIPSNQLHVGNLTEAALVDFASKGGVIQKGGADIATTAYTLAPEGTDEIAITIDNTFFDGAFQGSYTLKINSDTTVHPTVSFAVNRIIDRPQVKQGASGTLSDAAAADAALNVTTGGGNIIFSNSDFAKAVITAGRSVSNITPTAGSTAVSGAIKLNSADGTYYVDASLLTSGTAYTLTILTSNFADSNRANLNTIRYYITVQ